jgi:tetratricopeptide (TPR) repeat protein
MGRFDVGVAAARRAVVLDRLNRRSHSDLGEALLVGMKKASSHFSLALDPDFALASGSRGLTYYALGDFQSARSSCEIKSTHWLVRLCLAVTSQKLGQHADAEAMLARRQASGGNSGAYQYAEIYAQWGKITKALEWLEAAVRLRDGGLVIRQTDPLLDPLRNESSGAAVSAVIEISSFKRRVFTTINTAAEADGRDCLKGAINLSHGRLIAGNSAGNRRSR